MKHLFLCILLCITSQVHANTDLPWGDGHVDAGVVKQAQRYLNDIRTIKAHFTQVAPDGTIASGNFYMQRPGKMRWQYTPPIPVLMVSRGSFLRYIDYELEQVSDIPLDGTIASVLASKTVDFHDESIKILQAHARDNVAVIRVTQRDSPDEGELTFEFEQSPYKLRNIILKDAKGEETNISLSNADYNLVLDKDLFKMIDPRITDWRKGRR